MPGHDYISETAIHGYKSVLFGIPFVAAGIFFFVLADPGSEVRSGEMPRELIILLLAFFPFAGLMFIGHGLLGIMKQKKIRNLQFLYAHEPWKWDYQWKSAGIGDRAENAMYKALRVGIAFAVFLLPFNWLAFISGEITYGRVFWQFMVGLFDFITLFLFGYTIYLSLRRAKYGRSRIRFTRFPYFSGSDMKVLFEGSQKLRKAGNVTAILRYIEEKYERTGEHTNIVCYQLYSDIKNFSKSDISHLNFSSLEISFAIPALEHETRLRDRPPRYWELEINANTPGIDYQAFFLLPVYIYQSK